MQADSNVSERVSVEDYLAMRERAERAEAQAREYVNWLMTLAPVAGTHRAARRYVESCVAKSRERADA